MPFPVVDERGPLDAATIDGVGAAWMKMAAGGRRKRTWNITFE